MRYRGRHFAQRCAERGIQSIAANDLRALIERSVADKTDDFVEYVCRVPNSEHRIFRFVLHVEGPFYAVVAQDGRAISVLTQEMIRTYKDVLKGRASSLHDAKVRRFEDDVYHHARQKWRRVRRKAKR